MRVESRKVIHRVFLGAHRYTPIGGTVRPAGGVLQTAVVCLQQPTGEVALPLACFSLGEDPQSGAPPGSKPVTVLCWYRVLTQRQEER